MRHGSHKFALGLTAALVFVGGCKTADDYRRERAEKAIRQFEEAKKRELVKDKSVLSLPDCMKLAAEHNLEHKVMNLERDAAKNMMMAELFGMLPDLTITDNFTGRTNEPGSSSKAVTPDGDTYGYSTSSDRNVNTLSVDLAFSLLDFGLAFFNTQQGNDRMLAKEKQIERAAQNLKLEVVRVYFKVASAQRAMKITARLLEECRNRHTLIKQLASTGKISAFRATEETTRFLQMEKRLTNYTRGYESACVELRALLGVYPSSQIVVDESPLNTVPSFEFPDIELLEQMAILKRPELYEIDIQKHINVLECRKTLLMMMPNVKLYVDFMNNNNSFLYNQSWWELAVKAAYNALKTPQYISRYMAYSEQADLEEMRSFAQAITVMSQVRMAKADIVSCRERYEINRREHEKFSQHLKDALAIKVVQGSVSQLDVDHQRLRTAETEIERLMSLGAYYIAHYRLLNAIGVKNLDAETQGQLKEELAVARERAKVELDKARAEYAARQVAAEDARIARILFDDGLKLYSQNNAVDAAVYFERAAEKGNASAMFCLGKMYWSGKGVAKDPKKAAELFVKAADQGNLEAMILSGWLYYKGSVLKEDLDLALKYYRMAADNGDEKSLYWLGFLSYEKGDYKDALEYFKKSARGGEVASMVWAGSLYRSGKGCEKNYEKAMMWYKRAADQGNPEAMNNISLMYAAGDGVKQNQQEADKWFKLAENALAKK